MLANLLYFLFFETVEPSYGTLVSLMPEKVLVQASTLTLESASKPVKKGDSLGPVIAAESIYALDLDSGTPLFIRNIFARRKIASIAKLVTAMVILDNHKLDEKVAVSKKAASQDGSSIGLKPGEEITIAALLTGMLVNSGNDAAVALAEFDSGSEDIFIFKMNEKARGLGLKNTHFSNAKGFDEEENYSTAYDTAIFSQAALKYPFIRKTVAMKTGEVSSVSGKTRHKLENTNELLEDPYFRVIGLKTGRTPAAGQSFVALAKGPKNHDVLTVILDSPNRFKETKILIDWIFRNFEFP